MGQTAVVLRGSKECLQRKVTVFPLWAKVWRGWSGLVQGPDWERSQAESCRTVWGRGGWTEQDTEERHGIWGWEGDP